MNLFSKNRLRWMWILLGVVALLIRYFATPEQIEHYYSRLFFPKIRSFFSIFLSGSPVPLVYPFLVILLGYLIFWLIRFFKSKENFKSKLLDFGFAILSFSGALAFFFLMIWGFNYGRVPVEKQLGLGSKTLNLDDIKKQIKDYSGIIADLKKGMQSEPEDGKNFTAESELTLSELEKSISESLQKVLNQNGFPTNGRVRCRQLKPDGLLLRFATSGIYFPFTGEGHVDAALHPLQRPFVMAHEMAHGYGFTDEGICNFWAYLTCIHSDNLFIRYVGHLNYWRYLAGTWKTNDPDGYQIFRDALPMAIQSDLDSINESLNRFPDYLPRIRYFAYDTYLKAQGIPDGMDNYDKVIPLVTSWWEKLKNQGTPQPRNK